uniref:Secreted protein n=1 Tax=Oryzias sinensis TaxID=183150 RepID=A0A8C7YIW1_9TELE
MLQMGTPSSTAATSCCLWLAHLALPCSCLCNVITPLRLVKVQLLLSISEDGQVCHRPLLAKVGWRSFIPFPSLLLRFFHSPPYCTPSCSLTAQRQYDSGGRRNSAPSSPLLSAASPRLHLIIPPPLVMFVLHLMRFGHFSTESVNGKQAMRM